MKRSELKQLIREMVESAMSTAQQQIEELINDGRGLNDILKISAEKGIPRQLVLQAIEMYINNDSDRTMNAERADGVIYKKVQPLRENQTYKWNDGLTLTVGSSGAPTEAGWESFGYINGWKQADRDAFNARVKDEKPRTINLSMHHEAVYYPKAKVWYEVDSSG